MYSDKEGKGVSIGITPARMRDFINEISIIYPVKNKNPLKTKSFLRGVDFELYAGWVIYQNQADPTTIIFVESGMIKLMWSFAEIIFL